MPLKVEQINEYLIPDTVEVEEHDNAIREGARRNCCVQYHNVCFVTLSLIKVTCRHIILNVHIFVIRIV